jgi:putative tryptophan/tyrosine transport system substrate-binding protein
MGSPIIPPGAACADDGVGAMSTLSRRVFVRSLGASVAGLGSGLVTGCGVLIPAARKGPELPRVGYLSGSASAGDQVANAFKVGLQGLGYVEGQNITVDYRYTEGRPERLADLLSELLALKPDVLVAWGTSQKTAAKRQATTSVPIVFHAGDPIQTGLVSNLAHPDGNVTGVNIGLGMYGKRLELLKETLPGVSRVVFLTDPALSDWQEILDQSPGLEIDPHLVEVRGPDDLPAGFTAVLAHRADALILSDPPWLFASRERTIGFAGNRVYQPCTPAKSMCMPVVSCRTDRTS